MPRACVRAVTCSALVASALMALVAASAATAGQAAPPVAPVAPGAPPSGTWHLLPAPTPRVSPYDRLFVAPPRDAPPPVRFAPVQRVTPRVAPRVSPQVAPRVAPSSATPRPAPKVVCGLTVVPGDPDVDRGIAARMPDASTRFTMRSVEPAVCR
jgi:hypothetical protein